MSKSSIRSGQLRFGPRQIAIPYTEFECDHQMAETYVGNPLAEVIPKDLTSSTVKLYTTPDLSTYLLKGSQWGPISLPPTLTALSISYQTGGGTTAYSENGSATGATPFSTGLSLSGTAQASAAVLPKAIPIITENSYDRVEFTHLFFYSTVVDKATILARATAIMAATVLTWPLFKPVSITLVLKGTKVSVSNRATYQLNVSLGSGGGGAVSQSSGAGAGEDTELSVEREVIPPTLHSAQSITVTSTTSHTATSSITIGGTAAPGSSGGTSTASATGTVAFAGLGATTPTTIPASGLYLYDMAFEPSPDFGNYIVHAVIFDFAQIA